MLYHHGLSAGAPGTISSPTGREFLDRLDPPDDARERVTVALGMVDILEREIADIERSLRRSARRQAGCQALMTQFGVGELIALTMLTELGDVTRMSSSRKAVRFAGIDIGVHRSDQSSRVGKLTRQGSSSLRWALYKAAQSATRLQSPDYADYHALKARGLTHTRASSTIARKIPRRSYHLPYNLGPAAPAPPSPNRPSAPVVPPNTDDSPKLAASSYSFSGTHPSGDPDKDRTAAVDPSGRPINHHVATTTPALDDPDKAGHPRSQPTQPTADQRP